MGFEPASHPNKAAFGFPDFDQYQGLSTPGAFEWIIPKAGINPLSPGEALDNPGQGFQVEQWVVPPA